jgi:hypothetical protein
MSITFNRWLAIAGGILIPLVELVRRWHQLLDLSALPFWMDDMLIGAGLLCGAWRTRQDVARGLSFLAAGWAFACGMGYSSFFAHLAVLQSQPVDVSGVSGAIVVAIKGVLLGAGVFGLIAALRHDPMSRGAN